MKEIDRRTFLKIVARASAAGVAGAAVGMVSLPIEAKVDLAVNKAVGFYPPDADFKFQLGCENNDNLRECLQNDPPSDNFQAISSLPFLEETIFRALPSGVLSHKEGREDPILDVLSGTGGIGMTRLGMTRREFLVGAVSSVIFGALHNLNGEPFLKRIPASQILAGMELWYLQRKLGLGANILAHSLHNLQIIIQRR